MCCVVRCREYLLLFIKTVRLCCLTQANLSPIKPGRFNDCIEMILEWHHLNSTLLVKQI